MPDAPPAAAGRYVAVADVPGAPWRVAQEMAADAALRPLHDFRRAAALVAAATATMLALAAGLHWWRQRSRHLAALVGQYRDLAGQLRRQHDLLHGIMAVIPDLIGVKSADGTYRLVNPAFAAALDIRAEAAVGRRDADLLPAEAAAVLRRLDAEASRRGIAARDEAEFRLKGAARHLSLAAVPLAGGDAGSGGTVIVARDVIDAVMRRRARERQAAQVTAALIRAIELADPYLCGHSQRLQRVAATLAERLGLGPQLVATVAAAAALSQIGKVFVPRRILAKRGRHTSAETTILRRHVDHAQAVLRELDLDPPVVAALAQMYERLDGSGYPAGLEGKRIGTAARVLAVADVFCARTRPRSYREAVPPATALAVLRDHPERYDAAVVASLATLLEEAPTDQLKHALA
jgi:PAS domain S-box-containing protein